MAMEDVPIVGEKRVLACDDVVETSAEKRSKTAEACVESTVAEPIGADVALAVVDSIATDAVTTGATDATSVVESLAENVETKATSPLIVAESITVGVAPAAAQSVSDDVKLDATIATTTVEPVVTETAPANVPALVRSVTEDVKTDASAGVEVVAGDDVQMDAAVPSTAVVEPVVDVKMKAASPATDVAESAAKGEITQGTQTESKPVAVAIAAAPTEGAPVCTNEQAATTMPAVIIPKDPAMIKMVSQMGPVDCIAEALASQNGPRGLAVWSAATNGVIEGKHAASGGYFECTVMDISDAGAKVRWLMDSKEEIVPLNDLRVRAKFEGRTDGKWHACVIVKDGHKRVTVRWCYNDVEAELPASDIRDRGIWIPRAVPAHTATKWEFKEQAWKDWNEKNTWKHAKKQSWPAKKWTKKQTWQNKQMDATQPEAKAVETGPTGAFAFLAQPISLSTVPTVFNVLKEPVSCTIS